MGDRGPVGLRARRDGWLKFALCRSTIFLGRRWWTATGRSVKRVGWSARPDAQAVSSPARTS